MAMQRTDALGLGPVFSYEWITASRRWQGYALRSLFVSMLLAALVVVWTEQGKAQGAGSIRVMARVGQTFYEAVIGTQLTLVLLAAPAATAGAICLDRARGTLTHLLVTDLSDREIVLGKLAARLVPVVSLVACTLPVMSLLALLGGVDPNALFGAFLVTLAVAVLGCCLALVFSLWVGKTHEALLATYSVWGLWLLGRPMITQLNGAFGWSLALPPRTADPYLLAFAPYWWPGTTGWADDLRFLGASAMISALLALSAVLALRHVCTRDVIRRPWRFTQRPSWRRSRTLVTSLGLNFRLRGPTLDDNPVFWREWHRNRPSRGARSVGVLYVALATVFSGVAIASGSSSVAAWVNGLQVSIGLLLLSVSAATSLAEERVRGTLDVLMTTPLTTREIVRGKWLGSFRRVPPLAILPGLVVLLGGANNGRWLGALLVVAFVLCSGAAVTSLGVAMATWSSRLARAVGTTVTLFVIATVGWMFVVMLLTGRLNEEGLMMGSPFFGPGEITFKHCETRSPNDLDDWAIFWIAAYAVAAFGFLTATLATFDRCLGRVEGDRPRPRRFPRTRAKPVVPDDLVEPLEVA